MLWGPGICIMNATVLQNESEMHTFKVKTPLWFCFKAMHIFVFRSRSEFAITWLRKS